MQPREGLCIGFLGMSHLALSSSYHCSVLVSDLHGRMSVDWLSDFKDYVLPTHNNRAKIHVLVHSTWWEEQDGWMFQHLTDIHIIVGLTSCSNRIHWQYVQPWRIQLKMNACSNPQRTQKLMLKLACVQWTEAVDKTTSILSPVRWVGGYLWFPNKQHIHFQYTHT